ncbi:amidohydrolase [Microbacterium sp. gxy059]|uniref:amidohydrolase n=1 Tax=Microbacterium sp. gxy059 TaxID=2957199 RepID=UPI003D99522C
MSRLLLRAARPVGGSDPRDLLIEDGAIRRVSPAGSPADGAEEIDLDGRFVGPGLWDAHIHAEQWVTARRRLDLADADSAAATLARVAAALSTRGAADAGRPLVGYGFRDALWADQPTLAALDRIAGDTAVVLVSADLHCGWVSSAAARVLGLTPDATGVVSEAPWFAVHGRLNDLDPLTADDFREAERAAARRGVVGVVDFENADSASDWATRIDEGADALRVVAAVWPDRLDAAIAAGRRTGDPLHPSGLLTMGPLKIVADGSLNTRTAWCWDPYPGADPSRPDACGVSSVPPDELVRLLRRARAHGIEAAVHAIGDRANTVVLDAFEEVGMTGVVEHAQLVREEDFARFAALGLAASVQPEHAMDDRDAADRHWAGRSERAFAYGSLLRAGAELRLGSDAPVSPLDPWFAISAAVGRSREGREPWHPDQRIPVDVALRASSRSTIAEGEPADLVVTDADPLAADAATLRAMPVAATLLAGRLTWSAL